LLQLAMAQAGHPSCQAVLHELKRPTPFDYHPTMGMGYASRGGVGYGTVSLGLDVGTPLGANRRWQAFLGAHGHYLAPLDINQRSAFLAGARLGLEYRTRPASGGLQLGVFGEAGASAEAGALGKSLTPFVGGGARLGLNLPIPRLDFGAEAAKGVDLDSAHRAWFRLGLYLGMRF
jgi:hypothetical protein